MVQESGEIGWMESFLALTPHESTPKVLGVLSPVHNQSKETRGKLPRTLHKGTSRWRKLGQLEQKSNECPKFLQMTRLKHVAHKNMAKNLENVKQK